jgi:hypothetical protein
MLTALGALALTALPLPASAFSDPVNFGLAPLASGGGGRYFTGSPADGYTCKVCHAGGPEPQLTVLGLPLSGYRPNERYEITVSWPDEVHKFGAALELTDLRGQPAGTLQLPSEGEIQAPEFCEPATDGILAAALTRTASGRQVINLPDCGAKRIRFLWTAPARDVGPVWFAGSSVWSDGESDPDHDGVTDFGRVLSSPSVASSTTANCSIVRGGTRQAGAGSALGMWLAACVSLEIARRARRWRRSSHP